MKTPTPTLTPTTSATNPDRISISTDLAPIRASTLTNTHPAQAEAAALVISDATSYHSAGLILFKIRQARALVKSKIDPLKLPINEAHKQIMKLEHELDDPLANAERAVKGKMAAFQAIEQARVREEERVKQEALNRKSQEEARLAAEADRKRREEAQASQDAQRAKTQQERKEAEERAEAARRESQRLDEQQRLTARELEEMESVEVEGPVKAAGSVVKEVHGWVVEDFHKLVLAVARGEVPELVLEVNKDVVDEFFKADRAMTCRWPGLAHKVTTRVSGR